MAKSHFDILLIVISVTIVFVLPLLGWLIYALIKRHRENQLAINLNPRILSDLSSAESVSKFTYGEYLQYKKHLPPGTKYSSCKRCGTLIDIETQENEQE